MPETARPPALLEELPEARASGEQRRIYEEIKELSGVPMVALIYRHLATIPGALEWSWRLLAPAMRAGAVQQQAWRLAHAARVPRRHAIPPAALLAVELGEGEQRAIAAVLDAYNRANPVNIVAVRCLSLHLSAQAAAAAGPQSWAAWQAPPRPAPLPPMTDPAAMDPTVRALAQLLTDRGPTDLPSTLWPSLYRHLAHWPAFLGYASVLVPPEFGAIDAAAARLRGEVEAAAASIAARLVRPSELAAPTGAPAQRLQAALDQFSRRIPEMVVIGNLLQDALPDAPN